MRRPRHFSRHTSSAGGQAACGCPWDVDTVLWRRHTVAIARMCVCAPDDGRTAVGRIGFVVGETPRTAAPACARMSPCGQRAAARLVACESCWQHCRGGEAAHGCSCVRAYGAVVEAHSRSRMCEPGALLATCEPCSAALEETQRAAAPACVYAAAHPATCEPCLAASLGRAS